MGHLHLAVFVFCMVFIHESRSQSCSSTQPCAVNACCSQWGNCGYGPDFCGAGNCINTCNAKPECGQYADNPNCPLNVCCSQFGFCGTTQDFCSTGCQNNCISPPPPTCSSVQLLNIGYYASWSDSRICNPFTVDNIDPRNFTHLNYAFGHVENGEMVLAQGEEEEKILKFVSLKEINPNLKVLISIGGWAFNDPGPTQQEFHNIISTSESRQKFITSVQAYFSHYGFDGIDIDYEYPSADDRGGSPEDTENYVLLVKDLRASLQDKYLISIAAPASYWYLRHFKVGAMSEYLDWINVMTYDIHGVWDSNIESLGPIVRSHTNIVEIKEAIQLFLRDGVPSSKLILGLGLYGRGFTLESPTCTKVGCRFTGASLPGECTSTDGTLALFEIFDIMRDKNVVPTLDSESMSKILVWDNNQWIGFDDEETLELKRQYAEESCMGGVMFWSIDQGIIRVADQTPIKRSGQLLISTLFAIHMLIIYNNERNVSTFYTTADRDAIDDYSIERFNLISTPTDYSSFAPPIPTPTCSGTPTPTPTPPTPPPSNTCPIPVSSIYDLGIIGFLDLVVQNLNNNLSPGQNQVGDLTRTILANPNNPVQSYYSRLINLAGANGTPVSRIEYIEAVLTQQGMARTNFPNTVLFNNQMRDLGYWSVTNCGGPDEKGHFVGSQFGGPIEFYNMFPQHPSVNRNLNVGNNGGFILNNHAWYNVELAMARHLRDNPTHLIRWRVYASYADQPNNLAGRPNHLVYSATVYDSNGNIIFVPGLDGHTRNDHRNGF